MKSYSMCSVVEWFLLLDPEHVTVLGGAMSLDLFQCLKVIQAIVISFWKFFSHNWAGRSSFVSHADVKCLWQANSNRVFLYSSFFDPSETLLYAGWWHCGIWIALL